MKQANYLMFDATGAAIGSGFTPDSTFPAGAVECTADQAATPKAWQLVGGEIVAASAEVLAAQAVQAAVISARSAGLTITSTGTPSINGTYAIDRDAQQNINAVETYVIKNGKFPGSSGTQLAFPDVSGTMHVFPSTAIWNEFATAVADYVADLELYAAGAQGAALPASNVTIS